MRKNRPQTPDGRYFVARGVLRRCTNPGLPEGDRRALIKELMQARMGVGAETTPDGTRRRIEAVKEALGEAGPVWWDDGAPDLSGMAPQKTSYAAWWAALPEQVRKSGEEDRRSLPPPEN